MKKRIIAVLIAAVLAATTLMTALPAFAEESGRDVFVGKCGKNLTWLFDDETGVLTVEGEGDMYDYYTYSAPWRRLSGRILAVVIEEGVTSVGNFAFYQCANIETVEFPETLAAIGSYSFRSCRSLANVELPDSLVSIGSSAFRNCDTLTRVIIPDGVQSIGRYAFRNCDTITSVELGESVMKLGYEAFYSCDSLVSVVFKGGVPAVGNRAFDGGRDHLTVYYTPDCAECWAPEGETEWNGLPLAQLDIPAYVNITSVGFRSHVEDDGRFDLRFLAEGARLSDDTPALTEIGFLMALDGYGVQVVNCKLRFFEVDGRFFSYVLNVNNIPDDFETISTILSTRPYVMIGDGVQLGAEVSDMIYALLF